MFQAIQDFIGSSQDQPVILKTSAKKNKGIKELAKILKDMMSSKRKSKKGLLKDQLESELQDIVLNNVSKEISSMLASSKSFSTYLKKVQDKKMDPFEAADKLTKGILK